MHIFAIIHHDQQYRHEPLLWLFTCTTKIVTFRWKCSANLKLTGVGVREEMMLFMMCYSTSYLTYKNGALERESFISLVTVMK